MKNFILTITVLFGALSFAQSTNGIFTYESINGIKTEVAEENVLNVSAQTSLVKYNTFSDLIAAENLSKDSFKKAHAKNSVVINKTRKEVLVRFNGKYSSIQLVDFKGNELETTYKKEYEGLVLPRYNEGKKVFLKAKKKSGEVIYKRVTL